MTRHKKAAEFAVQIAEELIENKKFRQLIQETIQQVTIDQQTLRDMGHVRSFLGSIRALGITATLTDEDKIIFDHPERLTSPLHAMLIASRAAIVAHLDHERYLARRRAEKSKPVNGKK